MAAIVAVVALAACSGTSSTDTEPLPGDVEVKLVGLEFQPANVTVPVGERVVWRWTDRVAHNVIAEGAAFAPSKVLSGGSYAIRFDRAGTYAYECTLHDGMRGTVVAQ